MRIPGRLFSGLLFLLLPLGAAQAQQRPAALASPLPASLSLSTPPSLSVAPEGQAATPWLVLGGVAGGAVGLAGGAFLGYHLETRGGCEWEFCGLAGSILGGIAGEVLLLPLGVHLANGGRGSYLLDTLASAGVAAAGLLVVSALENTEGGASGALVLTIPVAQLAATVWMERRTARRRTAP